VVFVGAFFFAVLVLLAGAEAALLLVVAGAVELVLDAVVVSTVCIEAVVSAA
jgi:hypothetical protein